MYIRGDVGWSATTNANIHDRNAADHVILGNLSDIGSGWFAGGGVGAPIIPGFRGEIAYTYHGGYHLDELDHGTPQARFRADIFAHSVMANGYWDIPYTYAGIVPFLGVGLGWSEVNISDLSSTISGTTAHAPDGTADNLAWQLMVGAGVPVSPGVIVDFFYRYFDGGHGKTEAGNVVVNGSVVGAYSGAEGALHAHELGASLRFAIGG
jgi:opacity protein-like surface antigen